MTSFDRGRLPNRHQTRPLIGLRVPTCAYLRIVGTHLPGTATLHPLLTSCGPVAAQEPRIRAFLQVGPRPSQIYDIQRLLELRTHLEPPRWLGHSPTLRCSLAGPNRATTRPAEVDSARAEGRCRKFRESSGLSFTELSRCPGRCTPPGRMPATHRPPDQWVKRAWVYRASIPRSAGSGGPRLVPPVPRRTYSRPCGHSTVNWSPVAPS